MNWNLKLKYIVCKEQINIVILKEEIDIVILKEEIDIVILSCHDQFCSDISIVTRTTN